MCEEIDFGTILGGSANVCGLTVLFQLMEFCRLHYAALMQSAVGKVAYPPAQELKEIFDKEQLEKFDE